MPYRRPAFTGSRRGRLLILGAALLGVLGVISAIGQLPRVLSAGATPSPGHVMSAAQQTRAAGSAVPHFAHIVVVTEENKDQPTLASGAPYLDSLAAHGADFTNSHGVDHPSQGNYLELYSGSNQGLTSDSCPVSAGSVPNLYTQLGGGVADYSEGLPSNPSGCQAGDYVPWHNPARYFTNVPASADLPWSAFPADFTKLPKVSFVAPNLQHDMHNGSVAAGDAWLKNNLGAYATWAKTHNSLLIVTTDEDAGAPGNHIFTVFYGAHVKPGKYSEDITHASVFRTLEAAFGAPGINNAAGLQPITDAFDLPAAGTTINAFITWYGAPDNSPPGFGISYPGPPPRHQQAGGTGTYQDPETFASEFNGTFPPGTIIYYPRVKKYFVMEDGCACYYNRTNGSASRSHVDLFMLGPTGDRNGAEAACENNEYINGGPNQVAEIIKNPPPNLPVDTRPIYSPSTGCLYH